MTSGFVRGASLFFILFFWLGQGLGAEIKRGPASKALQGLGLDFQAGIEARAETPLFTRLSQSALAADARYMFLTRELEILKKRQVYTLSNFLPLLSLSLGESEYSDFTRESLWNYDLSFSIKQCLWDGGRYSAEKKLVDAELVRLLASKKERERELERTCALLLAAVLSARERWALRRQRVELIELEILRIAEFSRLGMNTELDRKRAFLALDEAKLDTEKARIDFSHLLEDLELLADYPLEGELEQLKGTRPYTDDEKKCEEMFLLSPNWPPLLEARLAVEEAFFALEREKKDLHPQVFLDLGYKNSGPRLPLSRATYSLGLSIAFSGPWVQGTLNQTLSFTENRARSSQQGFNLGNSGDLRLALGRESAALYLARVEEEAENLLEQENLRFKRLSETLDFVQRRCELLERSLEIEEASLAIDKTRYEKGLISLAEWLEAGFAVEARHLELIELRSELIAVRLERAALALECFENFFIEENYE